MGDSFYAFDKTKLSSPHAPGRPLPVLRSMTSLRDDYNIQIEFGDLSNVFSDLIGRLIEPPLLSA